MIRLKQKKKKKYKQLLCSVVLLALTLFVFGFAADRIRLSNESEQTTIFRKSSHPDDHTMLCFRGQLST